MCIFAYGQTGSGKTFTMEGDASSPGVNHNVVGELFRLQGEHAAHTMYEFKVSMMEVSAPVSFVVVVLSLSLSPLFLIYPRPSSFIFNFIVSLNT